MNLRPETKTELIRRLQDPKTKLVAGTMRHGDCFCLVGLIADIVDPTRWTLRYPDLDFSPYDWFWSEYSKSDLYSGIPEESLSSQDIWKIMSFSDRTVDHYAGDEARALLEAWVVENL